ncbi:uncharacterized protein LOC124929737 [Impatiens glandulifera]|uniref:uncharacterized protein LOC124929737 n=1 Tax=Impatiens glandulifera TaxID=253017 RepID=UPI001FB061D3|nr:uncharacterized protein LOC124929737 [Impatiens glandulifera]
MTSAMLRDRKLEKQMGCMTVFFQMFEKNHIMGANRRFNSTKGLISPPSLVVTTPDSVTTVTPPAPAAVTENEEVVVTRTAATPIPVPAGLPLPVPFPFPPRLSLDSRATMDSRGSLQPKDIRTKLAILSRNGTVADTDDDNQSRSPSVIARLMGIELLPSCPDATNKSELRRSASESRLTRDLSQNQFVDANHSGKQRINHQSPTLSPKQLTTAPPENVANANSQSLMKSEIAGGSQLPRRSIFDSDESFPSYGEMEKRMKMKGVADPSKELDSLKQFIEDRRLKGLLHVNTAIKQKNDFVYEQSLRSAKSHTSLMQSKFIRPHVEPFPSLILCHSSLSDNQPRRIRNGSSSSSSSSYTRKEGPPKAPNPIRGKRQSAIAITKKKSNNEQGRRVSSPSQSPVQSPRNKIPADLSPRNRRQITAEVKPITPIPPPQTDSEKKKPKTEESGGGGKNLLERCDKLLNSIAEMTAAADTQPSPVSVLQYKEESASPSPSLSPPSPVLPRCIDFKGEKGLLEYDVDEYYFKHSITTTTPAIISSEPEFIYLADIFKAITNLPEYIDPFLTVEEQYLLKEKEGSTSTTISKPERKAMFDMVMEIFKQKRRPLPPWTKAAMEADASSLPTLEQIWAEFENIRRKPEDDDVKIEKLLMKMNQKEKEKTKEDEITAEEIVRKDFEKGGKEISGWGGEEPTQEIADIVLDIERQIFKDLITETIHELSFASLSKKLDF